ncbi:hypothetical protein [Sphingobium herbicidovorans]|uniref:hypothetical protein n=1 Tax=Sphingobium herbicidovorans TaxID=76947 RepID=UPI0012DFF79B|nr:hypothetical protein [Sphingobium herbicidovorans]
MSDVVPVSGCSLSCFVTRVGSGIAAGGCPLLITRSDIVRQIAAASSRLGITFG